MPRDTDAETLLKKSAQDWIFYDHIAEKFPKGSSRRAMVEYANRISNGSPLKESQIRLLRDTALAVPPHLRHHRVLMTTYRTIREATPMKSTEEIVELANHLANLHEGPITSAHVRAWKRGDPAREWGFVYVVYDAEGHCLYVGETMRGVSQRLGDHAHSADWWPTFVAGGRAEVFPVAIADRKKEEARLIRKLSPRFNASPT